MIWYRKISTEFKVYIVIAILIIGLVGFMIARSGWIQERTFDQDLFNHEVCVLNQSSFNYDDQPRKSVAEVENIHHLIPVRFYNQGHGSGRYGVIDVDGAVVIEDVFVNRITIYGGIIRTTDENNQAMFFDLELNQLPTTQAARAFYDVKSLEDRLREINMNPAWTLKAKSALPKDFVSLIENSIGLELSYLSYYIEPAPFYSIRALSSRFDRVFVALDGNLNKISNEYFLEPLYFEFNGVSVGVRICGKVLINMAGEVIWVYD